jgi:hypothetical protein
VLYFRSDDEAKKNQLIMKLSWESIRQSSISPATSTPAPLNAMAYSSGTSLSLESKIRGSAVKHKAVDKTSQEVSPQPSVAQPVTAEKKVTVEATANTSTTTTITSVTHTEPSV